MILFSKFFPAFFGAVIFFAISGCGDTDKKQYTNSPMYDFANPKLVKLPEELDEISGVAYYSKDTSVFAIVDEEGILYKIPLKQPGHFKQWKFDKRRDFEDIVLADSSFYVLVSNGDIERVIFSGDSIKTTKSDFGHNHKSENEFESMYRDADSSNLVLICKTCEGDPKKAISRFSYNYKDDDAEYKQILSINMAPVAEKLGTNKHLKASAAAVNPVNKDLYVISSILKLLVIFNEKGDFKEVYKLDPGLYKQPEGIAFTPEGDLIISNEFADDGFGTLLLMKNKKKGK